MTEIISVRFKNNGKAYSFSPAGFTVERGQYVIVETAKGLEFAECVTGNHEVTDSSVLAPLRPVVRIATEEDIRQAESNRKKEEEAFTLCREKIEQHGLDMKLVDVEYNFEGNKILFFFTSDGRVDFRELVRDLAAVFKTRIELRQIGIRDEARMLGGLGICGRPFCCAQFLDAFQPVSIKMAKTQGLSLNPTKISGTCGRLMCCLKYEQDAYEDLVKNVPKVDAFVDTPMGKGSVLDVNILRGTARVRLEDAPDSMTIRTFDAAELEVLGGKAKRAEWLALKAEGKLPPEELRPRPVLRAAELRRTESAPAPAGQAAAEQEPKKDRLARGEQGQPRTGESRRNRRGGRRRSDQKSAQPKTEQTSVPKPAKKPPQSAEAHGQPRGESTRAAGSSRNSRRRRRPRGSGGSGPRPEGGNS